VGVIGAAPAVTRRTHERALADEVFGVMLRMHAQHKVSFRIVTHDRRLAARCDRVIELIGAVGAWEANLKQGSVLFWVGATT